MLILNVVVSWCVGACATTAVIAGVKQIQDGKAISGTYHIVVGVLLIAGFLTQIFIRT